MFHIEYWFYVAHNHLLNTACAFSIFTLGARARSRLDKTAGRVGT